MQEGLDLDGVTIDLADRTLIDMAERRPATLDDMLEVHGVGQRKLARYGDAFLEALEGALR